MTRIILNSDDFGLTAGINQSVLDLHKEGALTSATLMAMADQMSDAATRSAGQPGLGVGCHVVLVDGTPALPAESIPRLAIMPGGFRPNLAGFVWDLMRGAIPEDEIEMEAIAQIRRVQAAGVHVTHLDTHKHTHMFPGVLRPLLRAAAACGIRAVRNPFEPDWALKATAGAPVLRRLQVWLLRSQRREFLEQVERAGIATTDGAVGVLATGTLDAATLEALLTAMPAGTWELVCHPGHMDAGLNGVRTRLRESRAVEHNALLEVVPRFLSEHPGVAAINFGQL